MTGGETTNTTTSNKFQNQNDDGGGGGGTTRIEKVYILFGSQTGNSEQWAKEIGAQMPQQLSPAGIQKWTGGRKPKEIIVVKPVVMQLDDFLELEKCTWTRFMVIITSSYGVGQAPLGCYRFRELCDAWWKDETVSPQLLNGMCYAMCGLGDSKYTTFFENPTRIDEALQKVGAKRIGPLGKADASGTGKLAQGTVVEEWIQQHLWKSLAQGLVEPPPTTSTTERWKEMQMATVRLCQQINPDFVYGEDNDDDEKNQGSAMVMQMYSMALVVAILSILAYYWFGQ